MFASPINPFRRRIEAGEAVLGARSATFDPAVVETFGQLGLDFVWLDFEHAGPSPWDSRVLEGLARAGEVGEIEPLVRIPDDPSLIRKVLDTGIRTLLIPRIDSLEAARAAVAATRFVLEGSPGQRGYAGWRSSAYGAMDDYVATADRTVCVGLMVETRGALDDLEAILGLAALDFVFVGPSDLSVQLGHPDDRDAETVERAVARIESATAAADVPLGGIAHEPEAAAALLDRGYRIVRIGGELEAARTTIADRLARLRPSG